MASPNDQGCTKDRGLPFHLSLLQGPEYLDHFSAAFPSILMESWIRKWTARARTNSHCIEFSLKLLTVIFSDKKKSLIFQKKLCSELHFLASQSCIFTGYLCNVEKYTSFPFATPSSCFFLHVFHLDLLCSVFVTHAAQFWFCSWQIPPNMALRMVNFKNSQGFASCLGRIFWCPLSYLCSAMLEWKRLPASAASLSLIIAILVSICWLLLFSHLWQSLLSLRTCPVISCNAFLVAVGYFILTHL